MSTMLNGFHLALTTTVSSANALEPKMAALVDEGRSPSHVALARGNDGTLVLLLGFADSRRAALARPAFKTIAQQIRAQLIDLDALDHAGRANFEAWLQKLETQVNAPTFADAMQRLAAPPPAVLEYADLDQLCLAWARIIAEGALWVPSAHTPPSPTFLIAFAVPGQQFAGSIATVVRQGEAGPTAKGFWVDVKPSRELEQVFERRSRERRQGRTHVPPPGVNRAAPRFETLLEVTFAGMPDLASQWATDISHGGMFIACLAPPELRSTVTVQLTLPQNKKLTLEAEVVHRVVSGTRPGVGVQFVDRSANALAPIRELISEYQRRQPKVLVVDDEAIWRSTLARALGSLGCDVQLASDGREGLLKLIDGYFDLDLVILDLHMPNLDGRGLIERIRRQGGDSGLKLFLFSAAGADELQSLAMPGLATGVFSKLDSIDALTVRIARELGLPLPNTGARAA